MARTNSSTREEGRSSHWRSSIATSTGPLLASARTTDRPAAHTARWSRPLGPGSSRSNATAIARCCGSGSSAMSPSITGSRRSPRLENASVVSALVGWADRTDQPSGARPTASVKTVVLPIPGSPSKTKAAAPPSRLLRSCAAASSSRSRPTTVSGMVPIVSSTARCAQHLAADARDPAFSPR